MATAKEKLEKDKKSKNLNGKLPKKEIKKPPVKKRD